MAALAAAWLAHPLIGPSGIRVSIGGRSERLPPHTTLAEAAARFGLRPRAGDLLDVEGVPLRQGIYPGRLLVDGRALQPTSELHGGDRVVVADGTDRFEPRRRQTIPASVDEDASPQFFLDVVPGRYVVVRGAISRKLVSARFQPIGGPRAKGAVALTFDDGPSPLYTPKILAILRRLHVPATFFVIGRQADEYPRLVLREANAGMAVGDHTYRHPNTPAFARLPRRRIADEIERGQAALVGLGIRPQLFRPPGGSYSAYVIRTARELGLRVVLWSVDGRDWRRGTTPGRILRGVLPHLRPGSIIVLHDGGGDRSATVKVLPMIIKRIRAKGLELVSLEPGSRTG